MAPKSKDNSLNTNVVNTIKEIVKQELANITNHSGIANKNQLEILTNFNQTDGELLLRGKTNSFVVLGRDRIQGPGSGKGGAGHNQASSIDLVAGHGGTRPVGAVNGIQILSDKNFSNDSARIYISQLTDLDTHLGIPNQFIKTGESKTSIQYGNNKSGIAAKADVIRLVARENIKICTHHKGVNSLDNQIHPGGIDIIAGIDDLNKQLIPQPMVKGNNLKEVLDKILSTCQTIQMSVTTFLEQQVKINSVLQNHQHQMIDISATDKPLSSDEIGLFNQQLINTKTEHLSNMLDVSGISNNYLTDGKEKSINSSYNRVN